ncbi:MAG: MBL fold metallo-hydrolase [Myxococcota bacterium]
MGLVLLGLLIPVAGTAMVRRLANTDVVQQVMIRRVLQDDRSGLFEDGRLHVFTLGTGSPQLGGTRMPVATAVIAGDEFLILDAGEGASRTIGELRLPIERITAVFITHWHSDHFAGLGQILNQSWNANRSHEVQIHGPVGVERVVDGLASIYRDDIAYRSAGEVERHNPDWALGRPITIQIPDGQPGRVVFERNGVVVKAFYVDHGHVTPAYGYRVEYNGKSVVVSGDTIVSPKTMAAAQGCDLLVHEAVNVRLMTNAATVLREMGQPAEADRVEGVIRYHADTLGVAKLATEADVAQLVLSHIIPDASNPFFESLFLDGMDQHFAGTIVLASDGQHFAL